MLFAGWEVRMVENCDLGLENAARGRRPRAAFSRPRSQFFTIRTSQPANNIYLSTTMSKLCVGIEWYFAFLKIWPEWVDTRKYHLKSWYFLGRHKSNTISAPQELWDFPNMRYKETCKSFNQSLQSPGFIPLLEIPKCYLGKKIKFTF